MSQTARTRLLTAGVLIAVFGTGILVGLVVDSELGATPTPADTVETAEAPPEEQEAEEPRSEPRYAYERVGANESQLARIDSIVQEHRQRRNAIDEELKQVESEFSARYRSNLLRTREAIKSVLSADQAAEYQRLLDEWDAERQAERENGEEKD
ncbi:MAG: hypothetical protein R3253_01220 [Longimicrobiales bacterium]|nr:hypothetical protein [Longimicrobiales bacterium]